MRLDGYVAFHSYTFIFRFKTKLVHEQVDMYHCKIPEQIETYDQRRYARLIFESKENKIVSLYNKSLAKNMKCILTDISAGGIGFIVANPEEMPKEGDLILARISLLEKNIESFAKVMQIRDNNVGCAFMEKSPHFQTDINNTILQEVEWRSEMMLKNLLKREELLKKVREEVGKGENESDQNILATKLGALDPVLDYMVVRFEAITGLLLEKKGVNYKENTVGSFESALHFKLKINTIAFKCLFFAHRSVLYKLAKTFVQNQKSGYVVNANDILAALGRKLVRASSVRSQGEILAEISEPTIVEANKLTLSALLKRPSIQVGFNSGGGEFNLFLMSENLARSIRACSRIRKFVTLEKMELIEPISYSTIDVFSNYLKLDIREKSVITRDRLLPRFEISILLDIFFDDLEGKVVLNMSKKLALKIHEILLGEVVEDFNHSVKDAVAELTNMITGNAKNEFEKNGIYYKLSTPVVINCKDSAVMYARNMTFLSSVYWTSEGFFELSFSFFKKGTEPVVQPA